MKLLTRSFVILSDRVSNFLNGKNSDARMSLPCSLAMFAFSKSTLVFDRNFYSELEFEMVAFSLSLPYIMCDNSETIRIRISRVKYFTR